MSSEYYERSYVAYINNIPIEYVSLGYDSYLLLSNYFPQDRTIENLISSIKNVQPYLKYWLLNTNSYIIEYFKFTDMTVELYDQIKVLLKDSGLTIPNRADFKEKTIKIRENQNLVKLLKLMDSYKDPLFINKVQTSYYTNIYSKPTVYDFNINYEMPLVINKEVIITDVITKNQKHSRRKSLVIKDIKTDVNLLNSKFIQYFLNNLKPSWNIMLMPTSDFKKFKKVRCYVKLPIKKNDSHKLIINTPDSLWNDCMKIIEKNFLVKYDEFKVYTTKYFIKLKGILDQNSFSHYLMTQSLFFNFLVPIDNVKILKTDIRTYLKFVASNSIISTVILSFNNFDDTISMQYISNIASYRDQFYFKVLIASINNYFLYMNQITELYKTVFDVSKRSETKKSYTKDSLNSVSCQTEQKKPKILEYTQENIDRCKDPENISLGIVKAKEYENFARTIGYKHEDFLVECQDPVYKYLGMSRNSETGEIYACCYQYDKVYVDNSKQYKMTGNIPTTKTSRLLSGIKSLKAGEIGILNEKYVGLLNKVFNQDSSSELKFIRKSYEGDLVNLFRVAIGEAISYENLVKTIQENLQMISQNVIYEDVLDFKKNFEYLFIFEKIKNINISVYVLSYKGIEVGNYDYFYLKPYTNSKCIILYKDYNEDGSFTFNLIGHTTEKVVRPNTDLVYIFDENVNMNMYINLIKCHNCKLIGNSILNYANMDLLFNGIADYQLIDNHGKTYGIVISSSNRNFTINSDKYIFFDRSANMSVKNYIMRVEKTNPENVLYSKDINTLYSILQSNVQNYSQYLQNRYSITLNITKKDVDIEDNLIGLYIQVSFIKNDTNDFDIVKGFNNSIEIYIPVAHSIGVNNIQNIISKQSIYRLNYANIYDKKQNEIVKQNDEIQRLLIFNTIYNNFMNFIINLSYNQNIKIFEYSNYVNYLEYDLPVYLFYYNYDYQKISSLIPQLFSVKDSIIYINLPNPYYRHIKQYLQNPKLLIQYKSYNDTSDLLRIIQTNDIENIDIYNKRKASDKILDLIEPYYYLYNKKLYLVQKLQDNSPNRLLSMIKAFTQLQINLGYNAKESTTNNSILNIVNENLINVQYYDYNENIVNTSEYNPNYENILFIDNKNKTNVRKEIIIESIDSETKVYLLLHVS